MDTANVNYPMRAFIKHKAKEKFKLEPDKYQICFPLDDGLFQEIAKTLFQAEANHMLYEECGSREEASNIEDAIALELVETYHQIKLRRHNPVVQSLNSLL